MSETPIAEKRARDAWRAILAAHDKSGSPLALAAAEEALAAIPDDPEFLAAKGRQLTLLRRFAEAEACLRRVLELAPDHGAALLHLAQLCVTLGRLHDASGLIERAVAAEGEQELILVRAGRLLHAIGSFREAVELLARAAAISSDPSLSALRQAALTSLAEDAQAGAEPGDKALLRKAMDALRRGEPHMAEPFFAELTRVRPGLALGWLGLRGALAAQDRFHDAKAVRKVWSSVSPESSPVIDIAAGRRLGGRGLVFDPRDRFPIRPMSEALARVETSAQLISGDDALLVIDAGGREVTHDPVVSLDGAGEDRLTVSYRTAPKFLAALSNAALVGEGLVFNQAGELINEMIPPARPAKYGGVREKRAMTFDPYQFRDGMGQVRIHERPALLMCGPTDASFGDWIINFPPRLAFAEAAGLGELDVVLRRPPQAQALDILSALGVGPERIVFHEAEGVSLFARLFVPSWPTPAKLAPSAGVYDIYRRARLPVRGRERPLLFLTRRSIAAHQMANEDEVWRLFERRGFQAVDPGALTFAEVRELFANPACVAGPFGSAFHNLAFTAGRPVNLVLLPDHTRHYRDEIALWHGDLGLRFGYLLGQTLPDRGAGASGRLAPWIAPLDRLDRAIDTVLELAFRES